ncbi:hypothetical protein EJ063_20080 [Vibrio aquaticus]|uniref:DUF3265 domain-containing protein n=1 Tax=Vibrio aquaticus TaxID=2496559 RepID=A0A432CSX0_9VIBR|nr:hypothetical protein EJ063_20080 [Vibrio aquaticus]
MPKNMASLSQRAAPEKEGKSCSLLVTSVTLAIEPNDVSKVNANITVLFILNLVSRSGGRCYTPSFVCLARIIVYNSPNNKFKQIRNAWHFWFESALVSTAQWFRLGGSVAHYLIWRYVYLYFKGLKVLGFSSLPLWQSVPSRLSKSALSV